MNDARLDRHALAYTAAALGTARYPLCWSALAALLAIGWLALQPPVGLPSWLLGAALLAQAVAAFHAARACFDAQVFGWWAAQEQPERAVERFDVWLAERGRRLAPRPVTERTRAALRLLRRAYGWSALGTVALFAVLGVQLARAA